MTTLTQQPAQAPAKGILVTEKALAKVAAAPWSRKPFRLSPRAARSTACSAGRTAASSTTSSRTGSAPDRFLTVTNAANHEKDLAWFQQAGARRSTSRCTTALHDYAMLAVQGPGGARASSRTSPTASCPKRFRTATLTVAGAPERARLRHRLHRRGRRRAARRAASTPSAVWDAVVDAGATPAGLGARDTLRLEVCFHLYGNDLMESRGPIEAGLGWCCKEDTGFIGAEAIKRRPRARPVREARRRSCSPAPASPARATRSHGGGEVTSGTLSPVPEHRHRHGLPARPSKAEPGTAIEIDVRGKPRTAEVRAKPLYTQGDLNRGRGELPRRPQVPPRARLGARSTATPPRSASPGTPRTSSARSCSSTRRRSARRSTKDAPYAEVESVKAVSDVIAPLSGEIVEVNEALKDAPGADQRGPVRRGLAGARSSSPTPSEVDALLDAESYRAALS